MDRAIKHGLLLVLIVVGLSLLVLSKLNADAKLIGKNNASLTTEKLKAPLPAIAKPQLTSNPRQVLTLGNTTTEGAGLEPSSATLTCGLQDTWLTDDDMDPYKGPYWCEGQSPQTITESTRNIFTFSGGRISWWASWTYGTLWDGHAGSGPCPNPPLMVQSAIPLSHIRLEAHCTTNFTTITFTPNDGNAVQAQCHPYGPSTLALIYGNNITQVTITAVPNDGFYLTGDYQFLGPRIVFIESQPCECPTFPMVP